MVKKKTERPCPVCGNGTWHEMSDGTYRFKYNRKEHEVDGIRYALCDGCGITGYLPGQIPYNQERIRRAQTELPGFISPRDVLAVREKYLLSQEVAAKIFGGGVQAFSKWENGRVTPAEPTAKLIRLALEDEQVMRRLAEMAGETLPAAQPTQQEEVFEMVEILQDDREQSVIHRRHSVSFTSEGSRLHARRVYAGKTKVSATSASVQEPRKFEHQQKTFEASIGNARH